MELPNELRYSNIQLIPKDKSSSNSPNSKSPASAHVSTKIFTPSPLIEDLDNSPEFDISSKGAPTYISLDALPPEGDQSPVFDNKARDYQELKKSGVDPDYATVECSQLQLKAVSSRKDTEISPSNFEDAINEDSEFEQVQRQISQARDTALRQSITIEGFILINLIANVLGLLYAKEVIDYPNLIALILLVVVGVTCTSCALKRSEGVGLEQVFWNLHLISLSIFLVSALLYLHQITKLLYIGLLPGILTLSAEIIVTLIRLYKHVENTRWDLLSIKCIVWLQLTIIGVSSDEIWTIEWWGVVIIPNALAVMYLLGFVLMVTLWAQAVSDRSYLLTSGETAIVGSTTHFALTASLSTWAIETIYYKNILRIPVDLHSLERIHCLGIGCCLLIGIGVRIYIKGLRQFLKERIVLQSISREKLKNLEERMEFQIEKVHEDYLFPLSGTYFCPLEESPKNLMKLNQSYCEPVGMQTTQRRSLRRSKTVKCKKLSVMYRKEVIELMALESKTPKGNKLNQSMNTIEGFREDNGFGDYMDNQKGLGVSFDDKDVFERIIKDDMRPDRNEEGKKLCQICFEKEPDAVVMGCGHGGVCLECGVTGWKKIDQCHICRSNIEYLALVKYFPRLNVFKVVKKVRKVKERRVIEI